ncbi:hypothetical protein ACHRVW_04195 [Flavobacterium collinsii]|uniref:hypothetical protein n=1 Tax=Flavobacterium collinsii TaxID=1114861 RepID=UPI003757A9DF
MNQDLYANKVPRVSFNFEISHRDSEYVVTLKDSNFHLKISDNLFYLLNIVDSNKNVAQIVAEYNSLYNAKLDTDLAYMLLYEKLGYYNIIENQENNFRTSSPTYLKLNFIIIKAKTTRVISRPFLFLFSGKILRVLVPICVIIIFFSIITNYELIYQSFKDLSPKYFMLYMVIMILSSFLHELGHTSATYKYGGSHSGIGIGFYLFTPVLYADVSSAWKFDYKKRIIVNLGGIYFEFLFGTALLLISLIFEIKSLLIVPSLILFKTLFNLNPFFRTDGYWVLSDFTKTPNLRMASNNLLKNIFNNKISLKPYSKNILLLLYAIISNSFIFLFLFYLFVINPNSLINFPSDIYNIVSLMINKGFVFKQTMVSRLLIPIMFYYLFIKMIIGYFKKICKKNRNFIEP